MSSINGSLEMDLLILDKRIGLMDGHGFVPLVGHALR